MSGSEFARFLSRPECEWGLTMKSHIRAAIVCVCVVSGAAAIPALGAGRVTLNDTGMNQCFDDQRNWSLKCAHSHQDADKGRDVHDADPGDGLAGFSFRKVCHSGQMAGEGDCPADPALGNGPNDWGCTYDNISQLAWEMKTADGGDARRRSPIHEQGPDGP